MPDDLAAARLDRAVDACRPPAAPPPDPIEPELELTLRRLHALAAAPVPHPAFVRHLRATLLPDVGPPRFDLVLPSSRPRWLPSDRPLPRVAGLSPARRDGWRFAVNLVAGVLLALTIAGTVVSGGHLFQTLTGPPPSPRSGLSIGTPAAAAVPARLRSAEADVDAVIQALDTPADVVSSNVGGPWVVGWHQETGRLGVPGNVVLGGHLDYYTSGPAVFWTLHELAPGDVIEITGDNGIVYSYEIDWVRMYALDGLTVGVTRAIVEPTPNQTVTLITEAGKFNAAESAYESRTVVRGHRIARPATVTATPETGDAGSPDAGARRSAR